MTQDKDLSESIFIIWRSKIMNAYDYDTMVQFVHEEDVKLSDWLLWTYLECRRIFQLCRGSLRGHFGMGFPLMHLL